MSEASRWFSLEDKGDRIVIRLTVSEIPGEEGANVVGQALDAVFGRFGDRKLELHISALEFVSSAFLGRLISLHRRLLSQSSSLCLTGLPPGTLGLP